MQLKSFDYISDIHIDIWLNHKHRIEEEKYNDLSDFVQNILVPKTNELLIIAGDISNRLEDTFKLLIILKTYYNNIIIVPGNHEMYIINAKDRYKYRLDSKRKLESLNLFCNENNLIFLNGDYIELYGLRIVGGMMYSNQTYSNESYQDLKNNWYNNSNDSNHIYYTNSHGRFTYEEQQIHFKEEREKLYKYKDIDICITHFPPITSSNMPDKFKDHISNNFYYFKDDLLTERLNPSVWIYGHIHNKHLDIINGTKYISNPLGYPKENTYNQITEHYYEY